MISPTQRILPGAIRPDSARWSRPDAGPSPAPWTRRFLRRGNLLKSGCQCCPRTSPIGALANSISGFGGEPGPEQDSILAASGCAARQSNGRKEQTSQCIAD